MIYILYILFISALIALSIIDIKTYEIPLWINISIFILGLVHLGLDYTNWISYLIGLFAISVPLLLIAIVTKGNGMGGGDIKLMAAAGLFLGGKLIVFAFLLACIIGSVIHVCRMIFFKADRKLAFGPYLSAGMIISLLYGEQIIGWYIHTLIGI